MVDKLDEGGVQADEGETVQFAAAWTLATPHRVDDRTQPRKSRTVERPFDNDVAVAVELIQHPGDTESPALGRPAAERKAVCETRRFKLSVVATWRKRDKDSRCRLSACPVHRGLSLLRR
jgi:hypothetical protein